MVFVWLAIACLVLGEILLRIRIALQAKQLVIEIESTLANDTR